MLLTKVIMPENKYSIKCPYSMVPEGITVHNTANDASAMAEISYMIRNDKIYTPPSFTKEFGVKFICSKYILKSAWLRSIIIYSKIIF